jgi:hypothetical protein
VRGGVNPWTDRDDEVLRHEIFACTPAAEIAVKIGRTGSAVRARAYVPLYAFLDRELCDLK